MRRLKMMNFGNNCLKFFMSTLILVLAIYLINLEKIGNNPTPWIIAGIIIATAALIIFWVGILNVYITSIQLGVKIRVLGALFGWIPVLHLIMLGKIVTTVSKEYRFETKKVKLNSSRASERVCDTKYPLLMVHGVFFRDFKIVNYWGRIPKELETNGAKCFYGKHNSASSVDDSAVQLASRIKEILQETGAEKVNIIAHSKGGLDSRTAIAKCGMDKYVASLTTINTPHRGCEFADYLLNKISKSKQDKIAAAYNSAATKMGDNNPDFIAAVTDLTFKACAERNKEVLDSPDIYYQSFGSKLTKSKSGQFPLNISTKLVGLFDGPNDGLVGMDSFKWGENYTFVEPKSNRGISHGDVIDLNRENIDGYDVREFYVQLVSDLKKKGF